MRYNAEAIGLLTPAEIMAAIHPCQVTHNFLKAIISMRDVVQRRGGEFEDESIFRPLYADIARQAVELMQEESIESELNALKSTRLPPPIWQAGDQGFFPEKLFDIRNNLAITLRGVYTELLKRAAVAAERTVVG